ncbi:MAG TPA: FAD-binding domain [Bryobacteraceae bacterium]|nr:FAD-binding domain [Bryobacteraceae bacterium]
MRILISGAGIAGPTLAYWLNRQGFPVTLVEKSPVLRTGGYVIDFWGAGYEIAERMGLLPELKQKGYIVREVRVVDRDGRRISGFRADTFSRITGGRYLSLSRGDLAAAIFGLIEGRVESIFGDGVQCIDQDEGGARVTFESGSEREFDLVIGADGLHSRVREIAFGPEPQFENYLGYKVAALEVDGYAPRDELVYVMYTEVGRQIARFSMRGNRTMFLFTFADSNLDIGDLPDQKHVLREQFGKGGWECPQILDALDQASQLYFDRVSQIRMGPESWSRGRVSLVGDAAFCVSLLAGQGSALAMTAAYLLAHALTHCNGDYRRAFVSYQDSFGPFVLRKQKAALAFANFFAPKSGFSLFARNLGMRFMNVPWIACLAMGRDLKDRIEIPAEDPLLTRGVPITGR